MLNKTSELLIQDQSRIDYVLVVDGWIGKSSIDHEIYEMARAGDEKPSAKC